MFFISHWQAECVRDHPPGQKEGVSMKVKFFATTAAALALAATPVLAQANGANRAPAPVEETEELAGSGLVLLLLAAAAAVAGVIVIADGDDEPTSP